MSDESNFNLGSMDGYAGQDDAADSVSGEAYEGMLDEGFTTPEYEPNTERWDNENESIDDRLAEEVPDTDPDSAYGNPYAEQDSDNEYDDTRVGRLVAPDQGLGEDAESEMLATDDGYAGGASSAEEAAMHVDDGLSAEGFDDGYATS